MINGFKMFPLLVAVGLLLTSCGTSKRLSYIQDMEPDVVYSMPAMPDAHIAKGDRLSIIVTCTTPALAAPFNIVSGVGAIDPTSMGMPSSNGASTQGSAGVQAEAQQGYDVDNNGDIAFPVLGRIHAEGMTLKELKDKIEGQLISRKYIKDPVVIASFLNFHITVLGETKPGVYYFPSGKVNIFDALAMSGDMTENALRSEIWVVRTVDGNRRLYTIDLKTKDCFYSPAFFLQQNDMVYVKSKDTKFDAAVNNRWTIVNSAAGIIGTIVNVIIWTNYYLGR